MSKKSKKTLIPVLVIAVVLLVAGVVSWMYFNAIPTSPLATSEVPGDNTLAKAKEPASQPAEAYTGRTVSVADTFSIKVPNGWTASVSNSPNFLAIMFARPNQLNTLVYNASTPPAIDQQGIPSWNGLTEHFFVIAPIESRYFNPSQHLEVSSEPFTFSDGFVGQKYYVVKHAVEAQQWGGLQKDAEWQGRTYIYEKDGKRIEAHLALYPSTKVDIDFYENVVRSLQAQ